MSTQLTRLLAVAVAAVATTALAHAAPKPPSQDARIQQGERDGSLTAKEARRLRSEQDKIHALERKAASHGGPTIREQRKLDKLREKADDDITKYKHNDRGANSKSH